MAVDEQRLIVPVSTVKKALGFRRDQYVCNDRNLPQASLNTIAYGDNTIATVDNLTYVG